MIVKAASLVNLYFFGCSLLFGSLSIARGYSPKLEISGSVQEVGMPRRVLLNHIFNIVRLQRLPKSLACEKILQLHGTQKQHTNM